MSTTSSRGEFEINPQFSDHSSGYPPDWNARRKAVYKRDGYECQECGVKSGPYGGDNSPVLHAHHEQPISEGGSHKLSNLVCLCEYCHNNKHNHTVSTSTSSCHCTACRNKHSKGSHARRKAAQTTSSITSTTSNNTGTDTTKSSNNYTDDSASILWIFPVILAAVATRITVGSILNLVGVDLFGLATEVDLVAIGIFIISFLIVHNLPELESEDETQFERLLGTSTIFGMLFIICVILEHIHIFIYYLILLFR